MLKIDIISVQPKMFEGFLRESIVARAVKKGACEINIVDLREFGEGRWRKVDDKPYGGGPGMLMCCKPWFAAVESCLGKREEGTGNREQGVRVIMSSPAGKRFTQKDAEEFAAMAGSPSNLFPAPCSLFLRAPVRDFRQILDLEVHPAPRPHVERAEPEVHGIRTRVNRGLQTGKVPCWGKYLGFLHRLQIVYHSMV